MAVFENQLKELLKSQHEAVYRKPFTQGLPRFCLQPLDAARSAPVSLFFDSRPCDNLILFSCSVFSVGTMRLPRLLLCLLTINSFSEVELTSQHLRAHCVRQNSAAQSGDTTRLPGYPATRQTFARMLGLKFARHPA